MIVRRHDTRHVVLVDRRQDDRRQDVRQQDVRRQDVRQQDVRQQKSSNVRLNCRIAFNDDQTCFTAIKDTVPHYNILPCSHRCNIQCDVEKHINVHLSNKA